MKSNFIWIDKYLDDHKTEIDFILNPGLSNEKISEFKKRLVIPVPDVFFEVYRWHNGQDMSGESPAPFYNGLHFLDMESVLFSQRFFRDNYSYMTQPSFPSWVPFLESFNGENYCIDPEGHGDGVKFQVIVFNQHQSGKRLVPFSGIQKWIEYLELALKEGALLPVDGGLEDQITRVERSNLVNRVDPAAEEKYKELVNRIDPGYPKIL